MYFGWIGHENSVVWKKLRGEQPHLVSASSLSGEVLLCGSFPAPCQHSSKIATACLGTWMRSDICCCLCMCCRCADVYTHFVALLLLHCYCCSELFMIFMNFLYWFIKQCKICSISSTEYWWSISINFVFVLRRDQGVIKRQGTGGL